MRILPAMTLWLMASTAFPVPGPDQEVVWVAGLNQSDP
jgi:hypothetical protein